MRWLIPSLVFCGLSSVVAQDLRTDLKVGDGLAAKPNQVPEVKKAEGLPEEPAGELHNQDTATLDTKRLAEKTGQEIPEMDSLREKSVYDAVVTQGQLPISSVKGDRLDSDLQQVSAVYRKTGEKEADCSLIALSVRQRVKKNPETVLQVVDAELRANPGCSCEIVKAAILETDMQVPTVVAIVKVAFQASPENMRLTAQCAIAACPEALSAIQELLAKYDKTSATGDSAKSAKSAKEELLPVAEGDEVAATPNPLDFPGGPPGYHINFNPPPLLIVYPRTTTPVDP